MTTRRQFCAASLAAAAWAIAPRAGAHGRHGPEWAGLADLPQPVQEIYPALHQVGNAAMIVNAGGLVAGSGGFSATDAVNVYDPKANTWAPGVALPAARHHLGLVSAGGSLFAMSGFAFGGGGGWQMRTEAWRIDDPRQGTWQPIAPLPAPQSEAVYLMHDGHVHVIGGRAPAGLANSQWQHQADTDAHLKYDPATDAWSALRPLPTPRNSAAGAALGRRLFVVGGRNVDGGNSARCDRYDAVDDRWYEMPPLPAATQQGAPAGRGGLAAALAGSSLFVFGGEWFGDGGGVYSEVFALDLGELRWRSAGRMPRPRHGLGAVAYGGDIYVVAGATQAGGNGTCAWLDRFRPA